MLLVREDAEKLRVILCTDTTLATSGILEQGARRWAIEVWNRDRKQFFGFADSPARKAKAVLRTAPWVALVSGILVVWFYRVYQRVEAPLPERPWYTWREDLSPADLLRAAQQALRTVDLLSWARALVAKDERVFEGAMEEKSTTCIALRRWVASSSNGGRSEKGRAAREAGRGRGCVRRGVSITYAPDVASFQRVLNDWLASTTPAQARTTLEAVLGKQAVALDGNLRGASKPPDAPGIALVAAFLHHGGQVVDQEPVWKGDELQAVRTVVERMDLEDRIVTGDALQTQRDISQKVVKKKGTTFSPSRATSPPSKPRSRQNPRTPAPRPPA